MPISEIRINRFRAFNDTKFKLGNILTAIAGANATGKSTLLGMLGNTCILRIKPLRKSFLKSTYNIEFSDIFHGDTKYDKTGSNLFTVVFKDGDSRTNRITWQNKGTRFRIIPYTEANRSIKKDIPVIYLGLSRLFPIGEAAHEGCMVNEIDLEDEDRIWYTENIAKVLYLVHPIEQISKIKIQETDRKIGIGITTNEYGPLANSAGEDNIGQILQSILHFRQLKKQLGELYKGGLFLIDEIEATLHPATQLRLIEVLMQQCRQLNVQVVFTTHSLTLIKYIKQKADNNSEGKSNQVELVYITNLSKKTEVLQNPSYERIENELSMTCAGYNQPKRIKIYSEDDEARWFIEKLLHEYNSKIDILDINIGCINLADLLNADPLYFRNVIIILDGDASNNNQIEKRINGARNVVFLPGEIRPEEVLRKYLKGLNSDANFYQNQRAIEMGYNYTFIQYEELPTVGADRDKYKSWFKSNKRVFEEINLYSYWAEDNRESISNFCTEFIKAFNSVAKQQCIPGIQEKN